MGRVGMGRHSISGGGDGQGTGRVAEAQGAPGTGAASPRGCEAVALPASLVLAEARPLPPLPPCGQARSPTHQHLSPLLF